MDIEKIKELSDEDVDKMTFKQLLEVIDAIRSHFISPELDIEEQVALYSKAVQLLMKAREKLSIAKKQKEEIDKLYEEFIRREAER